jgi:hypothetical protein
LTSASVVESHFNPFRSESKPQSKSDVPGRSGASAGDPDHLAPGRPGGQVDREVAEPHRVVPDTEASDLGSAHRSGGFSGAPRAIAGEVLDK